MVSVQVSQIPDMAAWNRQESLSPSGMSPRNLIGKIYVCKKCLSMYSSMYSSGLQVLSQ